MKFNKLYIVASILPYWHLVLWTENPTAFQDYGLLRPTFNKV